MDYKITQNLAEGNSMPYLKTILITGASGLIGTRLTEALLQKGHQVFHLGREKKSGPVPSFVWDLKKGVIDRNALTGVDTIINLAGAGIADQRWTTKRKHEVLESRTESVKLLYNELKNSNHDVRTFINASAVGYYGPAEGTKTFVEEDPPGHDFLSFVTEKWEAEAEKISAIKLRLVKFRIGIVLSTNSGALQEMAKPVKYYVGAPLGSGKQYVSWIHIDDLCQMFIKAIEDQNISGVYNAVAPSPVTNAELTKAIARVLHRPIILPRVPAFALKIILGEMAEMVLNGNKVSSKKIEGTGFKFQFPRLMDALEDLLG